MGRMTTWPLGGRVSRLECHARSRRPCRRRADEWPSDGGSSIHARQVKVEIHRAEEVSGDEVFTGKELNASTLPFCCLVGAGKRRSGRATVDCGRQRGREPKQCSVWLLWSGSCTQMDKEWVGVGTG
jgi:hypothetical protein